MNYSLIIPVYNKQEYIGRTLESVLSQKAAAPAEILVVDDNSSDESMDIVRQYPDERIRIISRDVNGAGGYAARNEGIKKASYDWISFLDADDEWLPNSMEPIVKLIADNHDIDIFAQGWIRNQDGQDEPDAHFKAFRDYGPGILSLDDYLQRSIRKCPAFHTNCLMIRRDVLIQAGLFPEQERRGGDSDLWLRCLLKVGKAYYVPHLGARYYLSLPGAVTTSNSAIYGEHPVRKTVSSVVKSRSLPIKLRRCLKRYSDQKMKDWMEEQKRRKHVKFHSFRYFYFPLSAMSIRLFFSFVYHRFFKKKD